MPVHELLREAVLLTLIRGSERIDRTAIITALGQITTISDIDSLGNLGDISEWYVIFKTKTAREDVLKVPELKINDQIFLISEPYKHVKVVRLLNLPTSVPDDDIRTIASNWGGSVLSVDAERLPRPFEAIKSFVRRVRIRFSSRQDEEKVPISFRFGGFNVSVQLEGRQKVCYRCKQAGHIKAECCRQKRSYATAVVSTPLDVGHTAPQINQLDVARDVTTCAPMVNSSLILSKRLPYCRKCKQQGHKKQDCPRRDEEREVIAPVLTRDVALNEFNQTADVNYFQSMPGGNVEQISRVSALQHQVLIDAFKNADKELKRTNADRSIDSDVDMERKKSHICNSSTSTSGETEGGEAVEN
ncbi:unnamed protein product [Rotaria socialis]|uniref:CCHC-type domain-containing protein n=1 Tax=Rotaria socialis TaxID=392032 RepID=A0A821R8Z5_9BILA|nr:unnamed protein product [Rotaria socialis]